ncbi:MAG TPA: hypothetical protein VKA70_00935 [Blastocatellia bacterium]|nr:hypothetical protein [Blastocatellia bacterium]
MRNSSLRSTLTLLLIVMAAGCSSPSAKESAPEQLPHVIVANELAAMSRLQSIAKAEALYRLEAGDSYATLDELTKRKLIRDPAQGKLTGYSFDVRVKPGGFEATAVPLQPGISGKRSFYIDETNVLRGANKQGAKATSLDKEA